ncbi:MAG: UvrD-helicase domain-containing protein [Actinomycetota bacterium]
MTEIIQGSLFDELDAGAPAEPEVAPRALADDDARQLVRDAIDQTLFVEAGAGSGKTRALVDRIEALVESGVDLEHVAAITFTEKAAAELRDRVRQRFEGRHDERSRRALDQLDGAAIGTLHAFAQRILSEHAVEAGLPPGVEVLDEIGSQVEFEERWRGFVDRLLDDETLGRAALVLAVGNVDLPHLRDLALAFGANWDLVAERVELDSAPPPPVRVDDVLADLDEIIAQTGHCLTADDKLLQRIEGPVAAVRAAVVDAEDDIDAVHALAGLARHAKVSRCGRKTSWQVPIDEVRDRIIVVARRVDDLVDAQVIAAVHQIAGVIGRFTLDAADERRRAGRLEFHDLLVRARQLLRDPVRGPGVRAALRDRYRYLLLDEFQDTDPIQIELAVLIASPDDDVAGREWSDLPVDPGRLFFVGDPKQSIYRFRRADIEVFLRARRRFGDLTPQLTTNFRSTAPVIDWVNHVFGRLIRFSEGSQPEFAPLDAARGRAPTGPGVALLGADEAADGAATDAESLRAREADDVASAISRALAEGWTVDRGTPDEPRWEPAEPGDICVLLPARTSLPALERSLGSAGIPYRAETSSLVYATREVRDLLLTLRAVADPTDELALVAALRSVVYGCGDDDLAHWRLGLGGRMSLSAPPPDGARTDHPVAEAIAHLTALHAARRWSTPAELLDRVVRERAVLETAVATGRPRDVWRRIRFVVDQARAWSDAGGTELRSYLEWAALQGADHARVSESVLPETDDDSVRILTIHGAKGLEFPIAIVSGMTTRPANRQRGVVAAFPSDGGVAIRLTSAVTSETFERWQPLDEQMDEHERLRLLYVATTRARDHLVVSLHRKPGEERTSAAVLASALDDAPEARRLVPSVRRASPTTTPEAGVPLPERRAWKRERDAALGRATRRTVVAATTLAREATGHPDPGLAKRERDLELPPWNKGRYGTAIGRAVHGVLQVVDLADGAGLDDVARAQATAEGVSDRTAVVTRLARSALDTDVARAAATSRHWRELWVAAPVGDHLIEGYVDLLVRTDDGLVVVDWKTDHVDGDDDVAAKLDRYRLQGASYAAAVEEATGEPVVRVVFAFLAEDGAVEAELPDLAAAVAEVRARTAELAALSAGPDPDA